MKALFGTPSPGEEQQFWTKLKVYFFCEADEKLHWTDFAWMMFVGLGVLMAIVVTMI